MKSFLEKFNKETKNEYRYLRCREIEIDKKKEMLLVHFVHPENAVPSEKCKDSILMATKRVLGTLFTVETKFSLSHFDKDNFIKEFLAFTEDFPLLSSTIKKSDIKFFDNSTAIKISVGELGYNYAEEKEFLKKVSEHFASYYCQDINICLVKVEKEESSEDSNTDTPLLERQGGRFIKCTNVDSFVGMPIYSHASYIKDATTPRDEIVLCGKIDDIKAIEYKDKKTGETKVFYKIAIFDFTGRLEFVYFTNKKTKDKMPLLLKGKEIIIRGELKQDLKYGTMLSMVVKDISYCSLPKNDSENKFILPVPSEYKAVFPIAYTEAKQTNFFSACHREINPKLLNKTFVVLDLETTGLSPEDSRIIEIAGVKIADGKITETLSTLINPKRPIPPIITQKTGITGDMVFGKPDYKPVLIDFYKFCHDAILVAHNTPFDLGFIKKYGEPLGLHFNNKAYDTLEISRRLIKGCKNHKLETLLEYFSIPIENAHRALDDAVATAKLFLRLVDISPFQ